MKKRRLVIALFLIVATLTLSIGYAALVDELTVTGTAGVSKDDAQETFDGDIYFSKVISGDGCTAEILEDIDKGKITVTDRSLKEVGDEVIATYTIKSENDLDVTVTPSVSNGNSTYFDVTTGKNKFLVGISCDFKKLEHACNSYNPNHKSVTKKMKSKTPVYIVHT